MPRRTTQYAKGTTQRMLTRPASPATRRTFGNLGSLFCQIPCINTRWVVPLGMTNRTASILSVYSMNIPYMIHMIYFTVYSLWIPPNIRCVYSVRICRTYGTTYLAYIHGIFLKDMLHIPKVYLFDIQCIFN
jgi:hypothetical protein